MAHSQALSPIETDKDEAHDEEEDQTTSTLSSSFLVQNWENTDLVLHGVRDQLHTVVTSTSSALLQRVGRSYSSQDVSYQEIETSCHGSKPLGLGVWD